jgi:hypothetical protein
LTIRLSFTVSVDETMRRAIAHHFAPLGFPHDRRLATEREVAEWFQRYGTRGYYIRKDGPGYENDLAYAHAACCGEEIKTYPAVIDGRAVRVTIPENEEE